MATDRLYQGPIFVQKSSVHGYGVFAAQDIAKNEIVEECYFRVISTNSQDLIDYTFQHFNDKNLSLLPLGYGCLYNHSKTPNVDYVHNSDKNLIEFKTLRNIRKGEELFSSYGSDWFAHRRLKIKSPPWWRRLASGLKMPLRFAILYLAYLAYLQGLKYFAQ